MLEGTEIHAVETSPASSKTLELLEGRTSSIGSITSQEQQTTPRGGRERDHDEGDDDADVYKVKDDETGVEVRASGTSDEPTPKRIGRLEAVERPRLSSSSPSGVGGGRQVKRKPPPPFASDTGPSREG
ncbi:hypothetical protein JCM10212_006236 [Sporobolomyces blumeae]